MVLQVTSHHECIPLSDQPACHAVAGCVWANATLENGWEAGQCRISHTQEFTGKAWIGVMLSLIGDIIINVGMNSMKWAHMQNTDPDTGKPIKHFARIPWWWVGISGIIFGELGNLIAYGYAPAPIVTPIGSIGVVTNVLITTFILKEPFTMKNLAGVAFVIAGIVVVVLFAPLTVVFVSSANLWQDVLYTRNMAIYLGWIALMLAILLPLSKKYGDRTVVIYVALCAVIASFSIVCAKTFSTMVSNALVHGFETEFLSPWPYLTLVVMVATCIISMGYVNTAMMNFGNSQVVPCYFALFTTGAVGAAAWVYYEFKCIIDPINGVIFFVGILIAILGVFLVSSGSKQKVLPLPTDIDPADPEKKTTIVSDMESGLRGSGPHDVVMSKDDGAMPFVGGGGGVGGGGEGREEVVDVAAGVIVVHKRQLSINGTGPTEMLENPFTPLGPEGTGSRPGSRQGFGSMESGVVSFSVWPPDGNSLSGSVSVCESVGSFAPFGLHPHKPPRAEDVETTSASFNPERRRRKEKQVKYGRCGLGRLKPLPPLVAGGQETGALSASLGGEGGDTALPGSAATVQSAPLFPCTVLPAVGVATPSSLHTRSPS